MKRLISLVLMTALLLTTFSAIVAAYAEDNTYICHLCGIHMKWKYNDYTHWQECPNCGYEVDFRIESEDGPLAPHEDENGDRVCDMCGKRNVSSSSSRGTSASFGVISDEFRVYRTVAQEPRLYMYAKASSSGDPIAEIPVGTILTVSTWNLTSNSHYCKASYNGRSGYVRKSCLLRQYSYYDSALATYKVSSGKAKEYGKVVIYIYPQPSSSGNPVKAQGYPVGTYLKVVDLLQKDDHHYCYAVAPDGVCGFVRTDYLTRVSGSVPNHADNYLEYTGENEYNNNTVPNIGTDDTHAGEVVAASKYKKNYKVEASSYQTNNNYNVTQYAATDNDKMTAWNTQGAYKNEWIELQTKDGSLVRAEGFKICNGYWKNNDVYYNNCRVKTLKVYVDGKFVQSFMVQDYKDREQTFYFDNPQTGNKYKFVITDAYKGTRYLDLAVTELKLFGN